MTKSKSQKTYGFQVAEKSVAELEQDYANLAAVIGHKTMLVYNTQQEVERIQAEMSRVEGEIAEQIIKLTALRNSIDRLKKETNGDPTPVLTIPTPMGVPQS